MEDATERASDAPLAAGAVDHPPFEHRHDVIMTDVNMSDSLHLMPRSS